MQISAAVAVATQLNDGDYLEGWNHQRMLIEDLAEEREERQERSEAVDFGEGVAYTTLRRLVSVLACL